MKKLYFRFILYTLVSLFLFSNSVLCKDYPVYDFFNDLEAKRYNPYNVAKAKRYLSKIISSLDENESELNIPIIKYKFLDICNTICSLSNLKARDIRKNKEKVIDFDTYLKKYIKNLQNKFIKTDTKLEKILNSMIKLNWLFLNNFLEDEDLLDASLTEDLSDFFIFKPYEKASKNKLKFTLLAAAFGGAAYYYFCIRPNSSKKINKKNAPFKTTLENENSDQISENNPRCGLRNLGNTCYANSVLQVLFECKPLINSLINKEKTLNDDSNTKKFLDLYKTLKENNNSNPPELSNLIHAVIPKNILGTQQDAGEFLNNFFESDLKSFSENFRFQSITSIKCKKCSSITEKTESNGMLQLCVENKTDKLKTLHDCFEKSFYTRAENLIDKNQFECPKCKIKVNAEKKQTISTTPEILIISLNRFSYDSKSNKSEKIGTKVSFPITNQDISPYLDNNKNENIPKYNLIGIVYHSGSVNSGHYTSIVKDSATKNWHYCNDSLVLPVEEKGLLTESAKAGIGLSLSFNNSSPSLDLDENTTPYMLFYEKA